MNVFENRVTSPLMPYAWFWFMILGLPIVPLGNFAHAEECPVFDLGMVDVLIGALVPREDRLVCVQDVRNAIEDFATSSMMAEVYRKGSPVDARYYSSLSFNDDGSMTIEDPRFNLNGEEFLYFHDTFSEGQVRPNFESADAICQYLGFGEKSYMGHEYERVESMRLVWLSDQLTGNVSRSAKRVSQVYCNPRRLLLAELNHRYPNVQGKLFEKSTLLTRATQLTLRYSSSNEGDRIAKLGQLRETLQNSIGNLNLNMVWPLPNDELFETTILPGITHKVAAIYGLLWGGLFPELFKTFEATNGNEISVSLANILFSNFYLVAMKSNFDNGNPGEKYFDRVLIGGRGVANITIEGFRAFHDGEYLPLMFKSMGWRDIMTIRTLLTPLALQSVTRKKARKSIFAETQFESAPPHRGFDLITALTGAPSSVHHGVRYEDRDVDRALVVRVKKVNGFYRRLVGVEQAESIYTDLVVSPASGSALDAATRALRERIRSEQVEISILKQTLGE